MNEPEEIEDTRDNRRSMDPEVLVISRLMRMLDELDDAGRRRVVAYVASRYATT